MRILLLKDPTIDKTELAEVKRQYKALYKKNAGIDVVFEQEDMDFSEYPIEEYWGRFYGMDQAWLHAEVADLYSHYRENIDNVVFLVGSDNWVLDSSNPNIENGVWGWNISKRFSGYGVQQVRFDQRRGRGRTKASRIANSLGTLYHEVMHDHDAFVYTYLGILIEDIVGVKDWDDAVVHGAHADRGYIRHKENQADLAKIGPVLREAIKKRRALYTEWERLARRVIQLLEQKRVLLRQLIAERRGNIALLENNKCIHEKNI